MFFDLNNKLKMTTFLGIQILGVMFGVFMLYFTLVYFKRREFSLGFLIFWEILWTLLILISIFPHSTDFFLQELGLIRAMDFFMVGGFLIAFGLLFYNYVVIQRLKIKMEKIVRKEALKELRVKNDPKING